MPEQRMHSALAPIDVLTRAELDATLTNRFSSFIRDWYRGEDYLSFVGNGSGINPFVIPYTADSGYAWSIKMVSGVLTGQTGSVTVIVSVGDINGTGIPIARVAAGGGGTGDSAFVAPFSSNQVVLKSQESININLFGTTPGTVALYRLQVKQVPAEMIGKL